MSNQSLTSLLLSMADDEFILGYRNSEWTGIAPLLEEDVAFSSMSQDEIGHARIFFEMVGQLTGQTADRIAYGRQPSEYTSCRLMDRRDLDWGYAIARQFLYDTADAVRISAVIESSYEPLANAAQKILREEKYHLMHGNMWLDRLATLSPTSRGHLEQALNDLWPGALGIWEPLQGEEELVREGVIAAPFTQLQAEWLEQIAPYFERLRLPFPVKKDENGVYAPTVEPLYGGRSGQHSEQFVELWDEMTSVYRLDPEAVW